jgi:hypothetical protein
VLVVDPVHHIEDRIQESLVDQVPELEEQILNFSVPLVLGQALQAVVDLVLRVVADLVLRSVDQMKGVAG